MQFLHLSGFSALLLPSRTQACLAHPVFIRCIDNCNRVRTQPYPLRSWRDTSVTLAHTCISVVDSLGWSVGRDAAENCCRELPGSWPTWGSRWPSCTPCGIRHHETWWKQFQDKTLLKMAWTPHSLRRHGPPPCYRGHRSHIESPARYSLNAWPML